jgi:hypothetical protein
MAVTLIIGAVIAVLGVTQSDAIGPVAVVGGVIVALSWILEGVFKSTGRSGSLD